MWTELTGQLKSSANRWLLQVIGSLAGVMGVSAFVLIKAPVAAQYGMLLMLALFGLWMVFALVSYTRRSAASSAPAPVATSAPAMSAESRPALDAALQWLESKTQLPRKEAARARSWFLVIGGPKSGKTTLLSGIGLDVQFPAWGNRPDEARATKGYGVYITERAVVLDTPGEFLPAAGPGASAALVRLLKQVARLRPREPLNGILVVLDATQLLHLAKADLQSLALTYRDQLQKISRAIGRNVPVHLLVSKCDELRDFDGFFSDLAVHHPLTPAWGFALTDAERESKDWLSHCDRGLSSIYQRLVVRRTAQLRLADESARGPIIEFPERFQELRDRLGIFLEPLFGRTRTSGYSLIRGVFFLGALGGDTPAKSISVVPRRFAESARTLLREVVFKNPSRGSATGWRELWASLDVPTILLAGAALSLAALMAFGVYPAYQDNVRVVQAGHRLAQAPSETSLAERVAALSELRESLLALGADEHFAPIRTWHWTMFVGDARLAAGLKTYDEGAVKTFIESPGQCGATLAQALASEQDAERLYRTLKTYLMVTAPGRPRERLTAQDQISDSRFLLSENSPLAACWSSGLADAANTRAHLTFFVHKLAEHPGEVPLPAKTAVALQQVAKVRARLAQQNDIESYYEQLGALTSDAAPSIELIAKAEATDVLMSQDKATPGDTFIPGVFTRVGWETLAQPNIQQLTEDYARERAWVRNLPANANEVRDELRRRYFAEYRERWTRALQALRVLDFQSWKMAAAKLLVVSGSQPDVEPKESAYYRLLTLVANNTWGPGTGESASAPSDAAAVSDGFRTLHALVVPEPGKVSGLRGYLAAVHTLYVKMSPYESTDCKQVNQAALQAIGTAVLDAKEAVFRLATIDASLSNVGKILSQPPTAIGRLHAAEVTRCDKPLVVDAPNIKTPIPVVTVTLVAPADPIRRGDSTTIQWTSQGVARVIITPDLGLGPTGPNGSGQVHPAQTTTYTLEGVSDSGAVLARDTATVTVQEPPPPPTVAVTVSGLVTSDGKPQRDVNLILRNPVTRVGAQTTKARPDGSFTFTNRIDPNGTFELCYSDESKCKPVGPLKDGQSITFEEKSLLRTIGFQGARQIVIRVNPTQ